MPPTGSTDATATALLIEEHDRILEALDALEETARRARATGLAGLPAAELLAFARDYADRGHHEKEEQHLFAELEQRGMPRHGGPLAVMLHEHEQGRGLVRAAGAALEADDAARFADAAQAFASLLREHIAKENQVLFPMAERILDAAARQRVVAAFAAVEREQADERRRSLEQLAGARRALGL